MESTYCRFCAKPKSPDKVLNLQDDGEKYEEVLFKLSFMNALYVKVNTDNILPKTVCFLCYDSLNNAYKFLAAVKKAQDELTSLFNGRGDFNCEVSDDDKNDGFDYYVNTDSKNHSPEVKQELMVKPSIYNNLEVKEEPKEEMPDPTTLFESAMVSENENDTQSLNVQDIIDAAMATTTPMLSNITLYAKDISEISQKEVKTWDDYPWLCTICNIELQDVNTLRSHAKVVHGRCSSFMCVDCKAVKNFSSFVKHVQKHRKSLRNYCSYCNIRLESRENIIKHIKLKHTQKHKVCSICGEILENEEELKLHLQEFNMGKKKRRPRRKPGTPITIEDLTCPLCKKVYKNPNSLRDHMKLHNIDRKRNYTCDRCGKMFYNKGTLTSHIMSHDQIRPHVCRLCNKSFLFPNMLRRHVEMHSGVKPFSCEQCGRCFRLQYQLNAHKIVHTDLLPHVCPYCNKAFRFKQILKNHERQHTGAKPYTCSHCSMDFANWSNYNKHMKRRHGMDTSKKKITPDGVFPFNSETGQIVQFTDSVGTQEWKNKIMIPAKRGKKKIIKKEDS